MKKNYLKILFLIYFIFIFNINHLNAQTIVFQRDIEIWIANKDGNNQRFVCEGRDADISPDARYIAFTARNGIGYINIKSKKIHIFKSIGADQSYGPKWSPNSKMIAFKCLVRPHPWSIGIVNLEDTYFHILTGGSELKYAHELTWDPEGRYILCHGDGNIIKIDLNGKIISKMPYKNFHLSYWIANGSRLSLSSDGNYLLFDAQLENERLKELARNIAIFIHNILTGKTTRVTPAGIGGLRPCWMSNNKIIFEGFTENDIKGYQGKYEYAIDINRGIYSIDIDGNNLEKLIENGSQPSFSNAFMDKPEK